jgi:hypothetical protein
VKWATTSAQRGTSGSQFFVVTAEDAQLPPDYALLGTVTEGQDVVDLIGVRRQEGCHLGLDPLHAGARVIRGHAERVRARREAGRFDHLARRPRPTLLLPAGPVGILEHAAAARLVERCAFLSPLEHLRDLLVHAPRSQTIIIRKVLRALRDRNRVVLQADALRWRTLQFLKCSHFLLLAL